jgi:hypothetical protein
MARQFGGWLGAIDPEHVPFDRVTAWQRILEDSGFDTKEMVAAIVLDPSFDLLSAPGDPLAGLKTVRPEQYARTVEDLTGFRWWALADNVGCADPSKPDVDRFGTQCWGEVDLSDSDVFGYRAMAGGVDGKVILAPTRTVTPTKTLVMAQLAENAAGFVVDRDLATGTPPGERKLLLQVDGNELTESTIRAQIAWLHARILGEVVAADSPEVDDSYALFRYGTGSGASSPPQGWKLLISALLQDPRMMFF